MDCEERYSNSKQRLDGACIAIVRSLRGISPRASLNCSKSGNTSKSSMKCCRASRDLPIKLMKISCVPNLLNVDPWILFYSVKMAVSILISESVGCKKAVGGGSPFNKLLHAGAHCLGVNFSSHPRSLQGQVTGREIKGARNSNSCDQFTSSALFPKILLSRLLAQSRRRGENVGRRNQAWPPSLLTLTKMFAPREKPRPNKGRFGNLSRIHCTVCR